MRFWLSDLLTDTPGDRSLRSTRLCWRIEHGYRDMKHALGICPLRPPLTAALAIPLHPAEAGHDRKRTSSRLSLYQVVRKPQLLLVTLP